MFLWVEGLGIWGWEIWGWDAKLLGQISELEQLLILNQLESLLESDFSLLCSTIEKGHSPTEPPGVCHTGDTQPLMTPEFPYRQGLEVLIWLEGFEDVFICHFSQNGGNIVCLRWRDGGQGSDTGPFPLPPTSSPTLPTSPPAPSSPIELNRS